MAKYPNHSLNPRSIANSLKHKADRVRKIENEIGFLKDEIGFLLERLETWVQEWDADQKARAKLR